MALHADMERHPWSVDEQEGGSRRSDGCSAGVGRLPIVPPISAISRWPFEATSAIEEVGSTQRLAGAHRGMERKKKRWNAREKEALAPE